MKSILKRNRAGHGRSWSDKAQVAAEQTPPGGGHQGCPGRREAVEGCAWWGACSACPESQGAYGTEARDVFGAGVAEGQTHRAFPSGEAPLRS